MIGAKNGDGVYQAIINQMPPHRVYCEPFAGSAAIYRHKRRALRSYLVEADEQRATGLVRLTLQDRGLYVHHDDGLDWLERFHHAYQDQGDVLAYADPPYPRETRRDPGRAYYGAQEWTDDDHRRLLTIAARLDCRVLISGRRCPLYCEALAEWRAVEIPTPTRGGLAVDILWANYPQPDRLHDYRYVGADFQERWRIHKRQRSWRRLLLRMPPLERRAMLAYLADQFADELQ